MLLQSRRCGNQKNKEYSNFLHTYCDAYHARDIADRRSVGSTVYLFNGTLIYWCAKKNSQTSRRISNAETRAMYTRVLYKIGSEYYLDQLVTP